MPRITRRSKVSEDVPTTTQPTPGYTACPRKCGYFVLNKAQYHVHHYHLSCTKLSQEASKTAEEKKEDDTVSDAPTKTKGDSNYTPCYLCYTRRPDTWAVAECMINHFTQILYLCPHAGCERSYKSHSALHKHIGKSHSGRTLQATPKYTCPVCKTSRGSPLKMRECAENCLLPEALRESISDPSMTASGSTTLRIPTLLDMPLLRGTDRLHRYVPYPISSTSAPSSVPRTAASGHSSVSQVTSNAGFTFGERFPVAAPASSYAGGSLAVVKTQSASTFASRSTFRGGARLPSSIPVTSSLGFSSTSSTPASERPPSTVSLSRPPSASTTLRVSSRTPSIPTGRSQSPTSPSFHVAERCALPHVHDSQFQSLPGIRSPFPSTFRSTETFIRPRDDRPLEASQLAPHLTGQGLQTPMGELPLMDYGAEEYGFTFAPRLSQTTLPADPLALELGLDPSVATGAYLPRDIAANNAWAVATFGPDLSGLLS